MPLHVSNICVHHQKVKIALHSLWYHHTYRFLFHNKFYFMPLHVSNTCAHHQKVKIALHSLWYHHTYRWPSRARECAECLNTTLSRKRIYQYF